MDLDDQIQGCPAWVEEMRAYYAECDDGYARQSLVRIADRFAVSLLPAVVTRAGGNGDLDSVQNAADALRAFLVETIADADGRVRRASIRALQSLAAGYEELGAEDAISAIGEDLRERAENADDDRRDHLLEAADEVEFFLEPAELRMVDGLLETMDSS
jgi:hypothetical protein